MRPDRASVGRALRRAGAIVVGSAMLVAAARQDAREFPESLFARPAGSPTMQVNGRPVPRAPGYTGFTATASATVGGTLFFVGSVDSTTHLIAVREAAGEARAVATTRLLGRAIGPGTLIVNGDTLLLSQGESTLRLTRGRWSSAPRTDTVSPDASRGLTRSEGRPVAFADHLPTGRVQWWTVSDSGITAGLIRDGEYGDSVARRTFAPPLPPYTLYARLRPAAVKAGNSESESRFETKIAAFQQVGRRIWFGTAFYDAEFTTGIGGIGSFDLDTRKYEMRWGAGSPDHSTGALLVAGDDVWIGLGTNSEGFGSGQGGAHYSLATRKSTVLDVPGYVHAIGRLGDTVFFATTVGIFRVSGGRVVRVWVDWEK